MPEEIEITQKASPVSSTTQIGVQYVGMTPEQAARQTTELFLENFPKLEALARNTAESRATELCNRVIGSLKEKQVTNFAPFADPDVQYILYEAQKNYARFGEENALNILTELVVNRIQNEDQPHFKKIIDNAILIAGELSAKQLNGLSVLFMLVDVRFRHIKTLSDLKQHYAILSSSFDLKNISFHHEISYLNFKGCLQIGLPNIPRIQAETYGLDYNEVKKNTPDEINQFTSDYRVSEVGAILAIINAEKKCPYRFDPHVWIHD